MPAKRKILNLDRRPLSLEEKVDLTNLLASHLTYDTDSSATGGNRKWSCNHCSVGTDKYFQGSQTRQLGHLLSLPAAGIRGCETIDEESARDLAHAAGYDKLFSCDGTGSASQPGTVQGDFRGVTRKLFPEDLAVILNEYTQYTNSEGEFGDPDVMSMTQDNHPHCLPTYQWWENNGFQVPHLQQLAKRITCMISSSGASERNWSTYDYIHSRKRNRLLPARANDLVYVFRNMRLMSKFGEAEKFADWVAEEVPSDEEVEHATDEYEGGRSDDDDDDERSLAGSDLELDESQECSSSSP